MHDYSNYPFGGYPSHVAPAYAPTYDYPTHVAPAYAPTYGDCPTYVAPAYGGRNTFVLIVVLFILLIIVGACYCK